MTPVVRVLDLKGPTGHDAKVGVWEAFESFKDKVPWRVTVSRDEEHEGCAVLLKRDGVEVERLIVPDEQVEAVGGGLRAAVRGYVTVFLEGWARVSKS